MSALPSLEGRWKVPGAHSRLGNCQKLERGGAERLLTGSQCRAEMGSQHPHRKPGIRQAGVKGLLAYAQQRRQPAWRPPLGACTFSGVHATDMHTFSLAFEPRLGPKL